MTRWRDILFALNQLPPADLEKPAMVYNAKFDRLFPVSAFDHLDTLKDGSVNSEAAPLVAVIEHAVS